MRLLNHEKMIVGYDLCNDYAQISYCLAGSDNVETLSCVTGAQIYNIPAVLCKKEGANQWLYGKEAVRYVGEQQGILVENLLSLALDGEPVQIEGNSIEPAALLTLFMKRSLGMLMPSGDRIAAMMITCEKMDHATQELLQLVVSNLGLKTEKIYFQSHAESFYQYMIHQPEELWRHQTMLFAYRENIVRLYCMGCNRHTKPIVVHMDEEEYPFLSFEPMPEAETLRQEKMSRMDGEFVSLAEKVCQNQIISSVFLIGEHFSEEWMKESLRYLCRGKRVFQGNNLFSKGACYGGMERVQESEAGRSHVFLSREKLKFNVGMRILRRGQNAYLALLDAGVNWYDARTCQEFYMNQENTVELVLDSMVEKNSRIARIELEELPAGISRLKLTLYLEDENHLQVEIEDLGFGVFREATHRVWKEQIELTV